MPNSPTPAELLVELGVPKPEADAYVQLYALAVDGPATGYQVAKALGKDPTSVYKALEELRKKGYVETVVGRGKQFRPEDPEQLVERLRRGMFVKAMSAKRAFAELPRPRADQEVYRLATGQQTIERFKERLANTQRVALLDLAPRALDLVARDIRRAVEREVTVVVKLYREPPERLHEALTGATVIIDPDGEDLIVLMPGPVMHGVFDCRSQLVSYLDSLRREEITQAFWTANPFLAYQAHSGLASEIMQTALRSSLERGDDNPALKQLVTDLSRLCHEPVDWEGFWAEIGFMDQDERRARRTASRLPWRHGPSARKGGRDRQTEPEGHDDGEAGS